MDNLGKAMRHVIAILKVCDKEEALVAADWLIKCLALMHEMPYREAIATIEDIHAMDTLLNGGVTYRGSTEYRVE